MAQSSNAGDCSVQLEELEYLQASNANVSGFVSVKFSRRNFRIWQEQMRFLLRSQMMDGMLQEDDTKWRSNKSRKIIEKYLLLLKGWILGSLSEEVLNLHPDFYYKSPKKIWNELEVSYGSNNLWKEYVPAKFNIPLEDRADNTKLKKQLYDAAFEGNWWRAKSLLRNDKDGAATSEISTNGYTMLDIAVKQGNNYFVHKLLNFMEERKQQEDVYRRRGSSLHIAAKFGNTDAAKLLVENRKELLDIKNRQSKVPLITAFEERQLKTFVYLSEVTENSEEMFCSLNQDGVTIAMDLLTKAIYTKQFELAKKLVSIFSLDVTTNDEVINALIRNFPSELGFGEALIYPSFKNVYRTIVYRSSSLFYTLEYLFSKAGSTLWSMRRSKNYYSSWFLPEIIMILLVPVAILYPIYQLIILLILVLFFPFFMFYFLLWKAFPYVVRRVNHIEKKKKDYKEAQEVMEMIFRKTSAHDLPSHVSEVQYLEAARLDADALLRQFLPKSRNPMAYKTEKGHNMMQVAVINRSSKVYKLILRYVGAREYNELLDTSGNNLLHLAGKLPPSTILNRKRGAALQLQCELQWFKEVLSYAEHRLLTQRNIDEETPEMVFTTEHENLVKEGENWMKTTAESCSITAALIVTIVFAAAITVPGGSNQEIGIPLFRKEIAFIIFAVSDAISLFTAVKSLSVFLSILTTRFAEKDFLVVLPRRLLIGLFLLVLSTTAMMVAFSTILFLVFCDQRPWMLAPIGAFTSVPIAAIVFLQFPLMFDLLQSTYFPPFGKEQKGGRSSLFKEE